jgi:hypothetical protein
LPGSSGSPLRCCAPGAMPVIGGMRDCRGAQIRSWRSRLPVRIWPPKTPVCGAKTKQLAPAHGAGDSKKEAAHFLGGAEMKFRLIMAQRETFPVRVMCDMMSVSPAGSQSRPADRDPTGSYGPPPAIWRAQNPRGLARGGPHGEPWPRRTSHASSRHPGNNAAALSCIPHGQLSRFAGCPQTARPEIHGRAAQSDLARPASPACQPPKGGSIWPPCSIFLPVRSLAGRCVTTCGGTDHRGPDHGYPEAKAAYRPDPPFRSRQPIRRRRLSQGSRRNRDDSIHEPKRQLLEL